jgi:fatty-acyl-CoA synthase
MDLGSRATGLLQIEDCLDAGGGIVLPPGTTPISLIERSIANVGDSVAYRYLDYAGAPEGRAVEISWKTLGIRLQAIAAQVQEVTVRGDRVAILAPQGIDHIAGFFAAIKAGTIGVLTTAAATGAVQASPGRAPACTPTARHRDRRDTRHSGGRLRPGPSRQR